MKTASVRRVLLSAALLVAAGGFVLRDAPARSAESWLELSADSWEATFGDQDPQRGDRRRGDRRRSRESDRPRIPDGSGIKIGMVPPPLSPFLP